MIGKELKNSKQKGKKMTLQVYKNLISLQIHNRQEAIIIIIMKLKKFNLVQKKLIPLKICKTFDLCKKLSDID